MLLPLQNSIEIYRCIQILDTSGLHADAWRRLCTAFKASSLSLCQPLANVTKRHCTTYVDPEAISSLLANRLIILYKCLEERTVSIGDTARRIITKAALTVVKDDILNATGAIQMCAGYIEGCEAAAHLMHEHFRESDTKDAQLVDAFSALNTTTALYNVNLLCPPFSTLTPTGLTVTCTSMVRCYTLEISL